MKLKTIAITSLLLPALVVGALVMSQSNGTLSGEGHARTHDFPVIAQTFDINISDQNETGNRTITVTVPVKDITTTIGMRNMHMRTSMFDVKNYPDITFSANFNYPLHAGNYVLDGALTINGVEKPHSLKVKLVNEDGALKATGSTKITLSDYDLPMPGMGPMKVLDHVEMTFDVNVPRS
ncbi:MAG: YceI family protein [Fidelibacterota bacterium]